MGFEFGHTKFERYCCCTDYVKIKCHNLIEFQNGRYKEREINERLRNGDYLEMIDIEMTENQQLNRGREVSANNIILHCCCCPIQVDV